MNVLADFARALGQIGDPAFRRVLGLGIALTLALLAGAVAVFFWLAGWLVPDSVTLPLVGAVGWLDDVASGASVAVVLMASVFLMIPVASAFTSIFLDDVADAVEARHYPHLAPAPRLGISDAVRDAVAYIGILIVANVVAFAAYLVVPPAAPFIFLALNGWLLGREYFRMIAIRRLGRDGAAAAGRRHGARIWLAGTLMALPLTVPVLNLLVPVLGAATFTHLFHRLHREPRAVRPPGRTSQDRQR
jgi:uncharacterized protein involved in cysteine biosynthesis